MVKDNQPKHRQRAKERRKLERRKARRAELPTALVVCEGSCTEAYYLRGLANHLRVNRANLVIEIAGTKTDPRQMVRQARNSFKVSPDFDYVFVVCDGDSPNFTKAVEDSKARLRKADGNKVSIEVVATHPSFEFWLLLHFEYTTATMNTGGAIAHLKAHLPDYQKNDRNIFDKVSAGLDQACQNGVRCDEELAKTGTHSPKSDMPLVVEALKKLGR